MSKFARCGDGGARREAVSAAIMCSLRGELSLWGTAETSEGLKNGERGRRVTNENRAPVSPPVAGGFCFCTYEWTFELCQEDFSTYPKIKSSIPNNTYRRNIAKRVQLTHSSEGN